MAANVSSPRGGVLRFYARGGRVVASAEPQGDGWWWLEVAGQHAVAAIGRGHGRLHDVDLAPVAAIAQNELRMGDEEWAVDEVHRRVGPTRDPAVVVSVEGPMLVVRHAEVVPRPVALLVALALRHPTAPEPEPRAALTDRQSAVIEGVGVLAWGWMTLG